MKKSLLALATVAAMSTGSAFAGFTSTFEPFTVDPTGLGDGSIYNSFTAYGISGTYHETVVLNADGTYTSNLLTKLTTFDDATNAAIDDTGLRAATAADGYGLWIQASFTGTYTAAPKAPAGFELNFTFDPTGTFDVIYDPNRVDTSVGVVLNDVNSDSFIIGQGTLQGLGEGTCNTNLNPSCGSFLNVITSFELVNGGENFFTIPADFYSFTTNSGLFDQLLYNPSVIGVEQNLTGSMHVHFIKKVPEPSTLALLGLGLASLGLSMRRKSA